MQLDQTADFVVFKADASRMQEEEMMKQLIEMRK
jgi:hypothetical protein